MHAERFADTHHLLADGAVADDAERAAFQFAAHARAWHAAGAIFDRRPGNAAREVDEEAEHHLGHRSDEAGARLGHENPGLARRGDIDIADVDRAAKEGDQLRQALEEGRGPGRLAIGDDQLAIRRGGDQRLAFERLGPLVHLHLAKLAQGGKRAIAVVELARLRRMGQEDFQAAFFCSAASLR